jgi:hypothetical protein
MQPNKWAFASVIMTLALLLAVKVSVEPVLQEKQQRRPNLKPLEAGYQGRSLKQLSPGLDSFVAALLWIQLLQRASYTPVKEGEVSWEFAQLHAISILEPKFERAYDYGHAFLSVFRRDKLGAKILLESWVKRRPNYWKPHYLYGYHLFFEMNDYAHAAPAILRASQMERAPDWLASLGIRLFEEDLALEQALRLAIEVYPQSSSRHARELLRTRIRLVRFAREKQRLQKAIVRYKREKKKFPATLEEAKPFLEAETTRTLSSLRLEQSDAEELAPVIRETFKFDYDPSSGTVKAAPEIRWMETARLGIYKPQENTKNGETP